MSGKETNNLFPVFLRLEQMDVLIVGGGKTGLEKLTALITNAPKTRIRLVAIQISEPVKKLASSYPNVCLEERAFRYSDAESAQVVLVAVNGREESRRISAAAKGIGKLVNVADQPALCDFYMASIVQKGNLKIAISTNGQSPTMAKRLKECFQELIPEEMDDVLLQLKKIRDRMQGDFAQKLRSLNELTRQFSYHSTPGREENSLYDN